MALMWRSFRSPSVHRCSRSLFTLTGQVSTFGQKLRLGLLLCSSDVGWSCRHDSSASLSSSSSATTRGIIIPTQGLCSGSKQRFSKWSPLRRCSHSGFQQTAPELSDSSVYLYSREYMESGGEKYRVYLRGITKNMTLYTQEPLNSAVDRNTLEIKKPTGNPLVLIMSWLMAKERHLKKYASIYLEMGFDVMVVHLTPWQLLWPTKGAQIVAADVVKFLDSNYTYTPIVVHGFSVGAYLFGEVLLKIASDLQRYSNILNRTACQIWDSAADITEIPIGLPKSVFPNNARMQNMLRNYTIYHLKAFHNQATIHYMNSSQMFHATILKKPALILVSENDLIGPPSSNSVLRANWEREDVKVTYQCWQDSRHAAHFMKHPNEYLELLYKHLEDSGVLSSVGVKKRAKL